LGRRTQDLSFDARVGNVGNQPTHIFVFGDMLTSGAYYVAATRRLALHYPNAAMIGNFAARRILPNPFADLADDLSEVWRAPV